MIVYGPGGRADGVVMRSSAGVASMASCETLEASAEPTTARRCIPGALNAIEAGSRTQPGDLKRSYKR